MTTFIMVAGKEFVMAITPSSNNVPAVQENVRRAAKLIMDMSASEPAGEGQYSQLIDALSTLYKAEKLPTLIPALPLLLKLKGKPFSLHKHFVMEPMFTLHPPRSLVYKSARQISKSTSLAAQRCVHAALLPYFSSLYIAPRFEQTRRFSNNYVKPFLAESPIGQATLNPEAEQSVLQRTFTNGALLHFSFAFLDADRTRGISADDVSFDEVQDIDTDFIPIITETLSASDYDWRQYTGTPKTMDNTLQQLWEKSSQAEWVTKCDCGYWNIATVEFDLLAMIQEPGPSCARCGKLIDPATGHYEHRYPDRRVSFAGYHVPQAVMPMHYAPNPQTGTKDKWHALFEAKNSMDKAKFYNEKLGESCDIRVNLLTRTDLQHASKLPHSNSIREAMALIDDYPERTMGVDWGGGGERGLSYTTVVVLGHRPTGEMDMLYGERFTNMVDPAEEAKVLIRYFHMFKCSIFAHDFGGAGSIRETLLLQAGLPMNRIFPAAYVRATASPMVVFKSATETSSRWWYSVDKARSLVLLCLLIKNGQYRFPKFESWNMLADDFLALVEDKYAMPSGSDVYLITRKANRSDDFAHSVNLASVCYWHSHQKYPELAEKLGIQITADQEAELSPPPGSLR